MPPAHRPPHRPVAAVASRPGLSPLITTPFSFHTTATEVLAGIDLSGRRMIVTGANSGIGAATTRALASAGAEVWLAVRNPRAGAELAREVADTGGRAHVAPLDLEDRSSIDKFVGGWRGELHALINNAGIMLPSLQRSREGWELQLP